ncbi:relaxase/mobilization nuclease domain-containing protein [Parasphingorhabdus sp. DH2-15]|uniref:relaxase/mobilization nuclease domain-containing protein n=1 Tax=Parasphingorhabdus sp. DH2-15 TaxID=3444112 RepID=UPI003F6870E1
MILVGNARGGARDLAQHLMKDENDHVTVHELSGFMSEDLDGAFQEAYAISRGTRCKQFLFSLSLNPPPDAKVSTQDFERAIEQAESELGLDGQPRAIVFHEKDGRRHAHAVWSRIDPETMKARQLSFHKNKLQDVARELHREHGWKMPEGFADRSKSDPRNFTLEDWQQAKRIDKDPRDIADAISDAWMISDTKATFEHALKERGYWLACGDSKSYVAVDYHGEVYSIGRKAGVKARQIKERLGDKQDLQSVDEAKAAIAHDMQFMLSRLQAEQERKSTFLRDRFLQEKDRLVADQRAERLAFDERLRLRQDTEQKQRQTQFRKGLGGLWDRLRGEHRRLTEQHRLELAVSQQRDQTERDALIFKQQENRNALRLSAKTERTQNHKTTHELQKDTERYHDMDGKDNQRRLPNAPNVKTGFDKAADRTPSKADKIVEARRQFIETRRSLSNREQQRNLDRER